MLVAAVLGFRVSVGPCESFGRISGSFKVGSIVERERCKGWTNLDLDIVEAVVAQRSFFNGVFRAAIVLDGEEGAVAV